MLRRQTLFLSNGGITCQNALKIKEMSSFSAVRACVVPGSQLTRPQKKLVLGKPDRPVTPKKKKILFFHKRVDKRNKACLCDFQGPRDGK